MRYNILLNDCDAGELSISTAESYASTVAIGQWVEASYRGSFIGSGGFWVENLSRDYSVRGDRGGAYVNLSGRGTLAYLDEAIVWDTSSDKVSYTAKSAAYILIDQFTAAQARGALPRLRWDFNVTDDSNGDAWTDVHTLDFARGTSLLDMVRQFADLGIDFYTQIDLATQDIVLFAFGTPYGTDLSASVIFYAGKDILQLSIESESTELKNALLVERADGASEVKDTTSIIAYERREFLFSSGQAPTQASAESLAAAELTARKNPRAQITLKIQDRANVFPRAFVDYDLGDTVGVDFADGTTPDAYRIRGMELEWGTDDGKAEITLTLNNIILEQQIRQGQLLRRIATGTSAGATSTSTPVDSVARLDVHDTDNSAHGSRALSGGDLGGTLATPEVLKLNGVALPDPLTASYTGQVLYYNSSGNAFVIGGSAQVVASTNPVAASDGMLVWNVADGKLYVWAGGAWNAV
jgi:hypothetical protein